MGAVGKGCRWVRCHIWHYLDQTLPPEQREQVERHLGVCVPCRAHLTQAQQVLERLQQGQTIPKELQHLLPTSYRKPRLVRVALGLIWLVLVSGGVYLWLTYQGQWILTLPKATDMSASKAENPSAVPLLTEQTLTSSKEPAQDTTPEPPRPRIVIAPTEPLTPPETEKPSLTPPLATANPTPSKQPSVSRPQPKPQRSPKPSNAPAPPQANSTLPPVGSVEVYDSEGRLVKRHQIEESR